MAKKIDSKGLRARLSRIGKTPSDIARELGVNRAVVVGVIAGRLRGDRGDAHKVAVTLGLKDGVIVGDDMSIGEALKAVAKA